MEGASGGETPASATETAPSSTAAAPPSRYESQKRRDWNTFLQYLRNHKLPLTLARCSGAHVIEFFKYLDQFGKTKVHVTGCPYFGHSNPPSLCACPLKQAWGSLDALYGRLRAAFEENGGPPESNPFGARTVKIYLREVKEGQAKARGIPHEKKKRKRSTVTATIVSTAVNDSEPPPTTSGASGNNGGADNSGTISATVNITTPNVTTTSTTASKKESTGSPVHLKELSRTNSFSRSCSETTKTQANQGSKINKESLEGEAEKEDAEEEATNEKSYEIESDPSEYPEEDTIPNQPTVQQLLEQMNEFDNAQISYFKQLHEHLQDFPAQILKRIDEYQEETRAKIAHLQQQVDALTAQKKS